MIRLELRDLTLGYGQSPLINRISLKVHDKEIVSILGPSGAGKTTILKAIAGLLPPQAGQIFIDGQNVTAVPAEKRDAVLIFQKPLLFPFLNVSDNIGFGLKMAGEDQQKIQAKIEQMVAITGLHGLERRRIHQLSGGQQQRVALARGLILEPSVLLLDEPLSSLDASLREKMRELILSVHEQTATTMLFVTHDQSEAFAISDRICLLLHGSVRQLGTPQELFYKPVDMEVARFFGHCNFLEGKIENSVFSDGILQIPLDLEDQDHTVIAIRPEDIGLSIDACSDQMKAVITNIQFEGTTTNLTVELHAKKLQVRTLRNDVQVGQEVGLVLPHDRFHLLKR